VRGRWRGIISGGRETCGGFLWMRGRLAALETDVGFKSSPLQ
jgi:hypothetical protein